MISNAVVEAVPGGGPNWFYTDIPLQSFYQTNYRVITAAGTEVFGTAAGYAYIDGAAVNSGSRILYANYTDASLTLY